MQKNYAPVFSSNDLLNLEAYNACIKLLVNNTQTVPFSLNTYLDMEKVKAEMNPKLAEAIKKLSRLKYGRDRDIIEDEIRERA